MISFNHFFNGKRVFLTGHTGFKGAWLTKILTFFGAHVIGFALPASEDSLFSRLKLDKNKQVTSVIGDVRDETDLCSALKNSGAEVAFHMAAQPLVRASYEDPVTTYATNVMGTVHFLQACRLVTSLRSIVNVTTDKVYDNKEWCYGYREVDSLNGYDPYSNSKSCSELVTSSYKKSFFNTGESPAVSTARSGNVIGGGDFSADRILPDCIRYARAGKHIPLRNPQSVRPYQHVLDCLHGYLLLAYKQYNDKQVSGEYNFGPETNDCVTTQQLAELFCSYYANAKYEIQSVPKAPHEANFLRLDTSKAKSELGWTPRLNIRQAVKMTVEMSLELDNVDAFEKVMDRQIKEYFV